MCVRTHTHRHTHVASGNFSFCIISMTALLALLQSPIAPAPAFTSTSTSTPTHGRHWLLLIRFFFRVLFEKLFLNLLRCSFCCCWRLWRPLHLFYLFSMLLAPLLLLLLLLSLFIYSSFFLCFFALYNFSCVARRRVAVWRFLRQVQVQFVYVFKCPCVCVGEARRRFWRPLAVGGKCFANSFANGNKRLLLLDILVIFA